MKEKISRHKAPRSVIDRLKFIGPSAIVTGSVVGSGSIVMTPLLGAAAGFTLLWWLLLSIWTKPIIQAEISRYVVVTKKTFLEAFRYFHRQKPTIVHFNLNNTFSCFFPILAAYLCRVPWKLATDHLGFELAIGKRAGIRTKKLVKRVMTFCLDYTLPVSKANKQLLVEDYKINPHHLN